MSSHAITRAGCKPSTRPTARPVLSPLESLHRSTFLGATLDSCRAKCRFAVIVVFLVVGATLFFSAPAFGQFENFVIAANATANPPIIDGTVGYEEWIDASSTGDFIQFEPEKGKPASVDTVVKVLYDNRYVYFAFLCSDPEPKLIQLGTNRRDGLSSSTGTDSVTVELDTFNDDRSSYYFRTNPLGVQHDGRVSENGQVVDNDWDGTWKSAGAWTDEGWSAEIAIPFSTIKFQTGKAQTWGVQFSRYFPRNFERSFWTGPLEDRDKVSVNGSLTNLNPASSKKMLEIIPHVISHSEDEVGTDVNAGLDARYALTTSYSSYLTVNPDFATVEADREQVNLTRFELNLPEKRQFFIEGNDVYKQRIRLFYSRRIADIWGGLKVYGKSGRNELSVLTNQTKANEDISEASANFSVVRLRRDIMGSSNIGFLATNKFDNGMNRGSTGMDTRLFLTDRFRFAGQWAVSYGDGSPADMAFFLEPSYVTQTFRTHFRYTHLGEHFGDNANATGFVPDDNRRELEGTLTKTFWTRRLGLDRIVYDSGYDVYWGMDKTLRSWEILQSMTFDLQNRFSFGLRHFQEYKLFEKDFRNYSSTFELGYNTREWQSISFGYQFGRNYDSDFTLLSGRLRQNVTRSLALEYELSKLRYSPDPDAESTWIHVVVANYYFTKDLFLKVFYQVNSAIKKQNPQVVFVYRFQPPFGLVQAAYQKGTSQFGEAGSQGHTVFLKFAYVL